VASRILVIEDAPANIQTLSAVEGAVKSLTLGGFLPSGVE
jgi:hypothetical protein